MLSNQDFLIVLGALAGGTYLMRASGPLLLGNRVLPRPFRAAAEVLPATLLSALVVVGGFGVGEALIVDARAPGLAAVALALAARGGLIGAVLAAATVTALVRLAT